MGFNSNLKFVDESKRMAQIDEWPWSVYPPYFIDQSVIFPGKTIEPLLAASQTTPFYHLEDVYLTGVCSLKANVPLFNMAK